jgi:glycosyltransferase involved in cell wall biosynthesis
MLEIISITKDDLEGILSTVHSTRVLREQHSVKQIIVDSSSDTISSSLRSNLVEEKNIEYIWQEPVGISYAFNMGLQLSNAKWLWFLNGGDEIHPDLDTSLLIALLKSSTADAIIFELEFADRISKRPPLYALWPPVANWIPHPSTLLKRDILNKVGGFDNTYKIAMDGELWIRLFGKGARPDLISLPLTKFASGGISESHNQAAKEVERLIRVHARLLLKRWLQQGIDTLRAWNHFRRLSKEKNS